jgi:hypothetical protein
MRRGPSRRPSLALPSPSGYYQALRSRVAVFDGCLEELGPDRNGHVRASRHVSRLGEREHVPLVTGAAGLKAQRIRRRHERAVALGVVVRLGMGVGEQT